MLIYLFQQKVKLFMHLGHSALSIVISDVGVVSRSTVHNIAKYNNKQSISTVSGSESGSREIDTLEGSNYPFIIRMDYTNLKNIPKICD